MVPTSITGNLPVPRPELHRSAQSNQMRASAKHGIHAASTALRHAGIGVTAAYYVDSRARVTPGMGRLLKEDKPGDGDEPDDKITELNRTAETTKRPAKRKQGTRERHIQKASGRKSPVRGTFTRGSASVGWLPGGRLAKREKHFSLCHSVHLTGVIAGSFHLPVFAASLGP